MNRKSTVTANNFWSKLILMLLGISFYLILENWTAFTGYCGWVLSAFNPFLVGLGLAYFLDILVTFLEKHGFRSRRAAVAAGLVLTALVIALFVTQLVPDIWDNIQILIWNLPYYYDRAISFLRGMSGVLGLVPTSLLEALQEQRQQVTDLSRIFADILYQLPGHLRQVVEYSIAIGSGLLRAITSVMFAIYMLLDKERLLAQARKAIWALTGRRQAHWTMRVFQVANRMTKAFFEGKCIDSIVMAVLTLVVVSIFGLPYAGLLSLVIGITNIVPIAGPVVGGALGFFLLVLENPVQGLIFLVAIILLQQLDSKVISPMILGDRIGLSTLWVLVALVLGGKIAGVLGMILGVPLLATVIAVVGEMVTQHRNERHASRIAVRITEEDE